MLGEGMIVSPVIRPASPESKLAGTEVYLPDGWWTDFFTGMCYRGGRLLTMYRSLENIPVLVKAGTMIPMDGEKIPSNGAPLPETVLLRVFTGADGTANLIEDNGKHPADAEYKQATTVIRLRQGAEVTLEIQPSQGETSILPPRRRYIVEMNHFANMEPRESNCRYKASYDAERRILRLGLNTDAAVGAILRWTGDVEPPALDWQGHLQALLMPAAIPFDLKDTVMRIAHASRTNEDFLAQLHMLSLPESLFGAVLELLSAC